MTGQPGAGKTTLSKLLISHLEKGGDNKVFHIDGDNLRALTLNHDYSRDGRMRNIEGAQKIAHYLHNEGYDVVVSVVSPYKWQRDELKNKLKSDILEIYVHTSSERERDHFKTDEYEPPTKNFLDMDTTNDTPQQSLEKIINIINEEI
jgi:adenylylsulfate kinase-like enzyme